MTEPREKQVAGYGTWRTPVTSGLVVKQAVRLGQVAVDGVDVLWSEERPNEAGRTEVVRRSPDGSTVDLLGPDYNARTAVHEYGGGAWWSRKGVLWFANWSDQRLYRRDPSGACEPLTPEPPVPRGDRYADGDISPDGHRIVCVRERHPAGGSGAVDVRNEIVVLDADRPSEPEVLVTGPDFVVAPRWSPEGHYLCWIEWDHPNMPWDGTRLMVRDLRSGEHRQVAGGPEESVSEPSWGADGALTFISDRSGWWSLYRWDPADDQVRPLVEIEAEVGVPAWQLATSRYAMLADGRIVFAAASNGLDRLFVRLSDGDVEPLELPFSSALSLHRCGDSSVVMVAATPVSEPSVVRLELAEAGRVAERLQLRAPRELGVEPGYWSAPEPIEFPSGGGRTAHGLFYAPTHPELTGPDGERPPLIVMIHGGPTAAAQPVLNVALQYWTTRGFAVVDVNYGGSTGFGREYRDLLKGTWGIVDVEDCIAAAAWLAAQGRVDGDRLCIRGGSAGGFTTLAVLTRPDTPFSAGASYFGVADLSALARETHKFESRYLDGMVAPFPERQDVYDERSPINHVDEIGRPLLVLQGAEDAVVPPEQSRRIVEALRAKQLPVAYLEFPGEQHGFRKAENIRNALDSELSFYSQVLRFDLPANEGIRPVEVENL